MSIDRLKTAIVILAVGGVTLMTRDLAARTDALAEGMGYTAEAFQRPSRSLGWRLPGQSPAFDDQAGLDLVEFTTACSLGPGPGNELLDALVKRYLVGVPLAFAVFALFRRVRDAANQT